MPRRPARGRRDRVPRARASRSIMRWRRSRVRPAGPAPRSRAGAARRANILSSGTQNSRSAPVIRPRRPQWGQDSEMLSEGQVFDQKIGARQERRVDCARSASEVPRSIDSFPRHFLRAPRPAAAFLARGRDTARSLAGRALLRCVARAMLALLHCGLRKRRTGFRPEHRAGWRLIPSQPIRSHRRCAGPAAVVPWR